MFEKYRYKLHQLLKKTSGNNQHKKADNVLDYWNERFDEHAFHHSRQNNYIASDFLNELDKNSTMLKSFHEASSLLEVGCGTGEFCQIIRERFPNFTKILGTDLSEEGIKYSNKHNKATTIIDYKVFNSLDKQDGFKEFGQFDLALCSNVLEHFFDPFPLVNQMLDIATQLCILVPYNHLSDDNELVGDGGEGHVFRWTEESFKNYKSLASFKFKTKGWSNVTNHPDPWQLAILITRK